MFLELNNILGLDVANLSLDKMVCVTESCADGSFILHHYISLCLKHNGKVALLGLAQAYNHYKNVATKLSLSLTQFQEEKRFIFIEGLKMIGGEILCSENTSSENLINFEANGELKMLYEYIKDALSDFQATAKKPALFVIDDISVLVSLGVSPSQVICFLSYLRNFLETWGCSLLVLCQRLEGKLSDEDEDMDVLWKHLCHQSDLVLHTEGLSSGYCSDIHGKLTITRRNILTSQSQKVKKIVQFKISDRNVSFFAPGLSTTVIGH